MLVLDVRKTALSGGMFKIRVEFLRDDGTRDRGEYRGTLAETKRVVPLLDAWGRFPTDEEIEENLFPVIEPPF